MKISNLFTHISKSSKTSNVCEFVDLLRTYKTNYPVLGLNGKLTAAEFDNLTYGDIASLKFSCPIWATYNYNKTKLNFYFSTSQGYCIQNLKIFDSFELFEFESIELYIYYIDVLKHKNIIDIILLNFPNIILDGQAPITDAEQKALIAKKAHNI